MRPAAISKLLLAASLGLVASWTEAEASTSSARPYSSHTVLLSDSGPISALMHEEVLAIQLEDRTLIYQRDPVERERWSFVRRIASFACLKALSGDTLVLSDCVNLRQSCDIDEGLSLYTYRRDRGGPNNWGLLQRLRADFPEPTGHTFGFSVALEGDLMAVGDPENQTVRVLERGLDGSTGWTETARLSRDKRPNDGSFGTDVAISGNTLAVGAANYCVGPTNTDFHSEGVYLFERDPASREGWREVRRLDSTGEGIPGEWVELEGPTLFLDGVDGIEVHERDHRGRDRWGQRQLLETRSFFSVRGRTAFQNERLQEGRGVTIYDRTDSARSPWSITQRLPMPEDAAGMGAVGLGSREVVAISRTERSDGPQRHDLILFHRDAIHADDFEAGELGSWDLRKRKVQVTAPGLGDSAHALETLVDGKGKKSFLRTRSPDKEPMVSVEMRFNANGVDLGGQQVEILRLSGGGRANASLSLREEGGGYKVVLAARQNRGPILEIGELDIPTRRDVFLVLEWRRATGDGHGNGVVRLTRDGRSSVHSSRLATDQLSITDLRVGLPSGAKGTAGGSFLIDDIEVHQ